MKTVWVVEKGEYSDYHVVGIFSSKENAQFIADAVNSECRYDKATIVEWTLDPAIKELHSGMAKYKVTMLRNGDVERCEKDSSVSSYDLAGNVWIWRRTEAPAYQGKGIPDAMNSSVWAKNEKHAIKIANEHRTRLIAAGEWD